MNRLQWWMIVGGLCISAITVAAEQQTVSAVSDEPHTVLGAWALLELQNTKTAETSVQNTQPNATSVQKRRVSQRVERDEESIEESQDIADTVEEYLLLLQPAQRKLLSKLIPLYQFPLHSTPADVQHTLRALEQLPTAYAEKIVRCFSLLVGKSFTRQERLELLGLVSQVNIRCQTVDQEEQAHTWVYVTIFRRICSTHPSFYATMHAMHLKAYSEFGLCDRFMRVALLHPSVGPPMDKIYKILCTSLQKAVLHAVPGNTADPDDIFDAALKLRAEVTKQSRT